MQKLVITDIKDHREYERERDEFRSSVIDPRKHPPQAEVVTPRPPYRRAFFFAGFVS